MGEADAGGAQRARPTRPKRRRRPRGRLRLFPGAAGTRAGARPLLRRAAGARPSRAARGFFRAGRRDARRARRDLRARRCRRRTPRRRCRIISPPISSSIRRGRTTRSRSARSRWWRTRWPRTRRRGRPAARRAGAGAAHLARRVWNRVRRQGRRLLARLRRCGTWLSAHSAMMASSASRPSVSAAGPGCRISGDLISRRKPSRPPGWRRSPARAATFAGTNFLPHQEPMMMSGARRDHLRRRVTMRSLALLCPARCRKHVDAAGDLDQLRHPADAGDHRLVPFLEIDSRPARQPRRALARLLRAAAPASAPARPPCRSRRPARRACGSWRKCRRRRAG